MRIEWATLCRDVITDEHGDRVVVGLGVNGFLVGGPGTATVAILICLVGDATDTEGEISSIRYRTLDPNGLLIGAGDSPIERWIGDAPQVVDPERFFYTVWIDIAVKMYGTHLVEVFTSSPEKIRLPLVFELPSP